MADPALAASRPARPGTGFDIQRFLRARGTVYMIAEAVHRGRPGRPAVRRHGRRDPLQAAAQIGQASAVGRLDPPLLMGLDEVTQICPVPLPAWLSDSGGKGIQVMRRRARRGPAGRAGGASTAARSC